VIGTDSDRTINVKTAVHLPLYQVKTPFIVTASKNAELIEYPANQFLAMKVSFVNERANLCDAAGRHVDIHVVTHALARSADPVPDSEATAFRRTPTLYVTLPDNSEGSSGRSAQPSR
jgi:UDP-glucose 6-dehydrogenase